MAEEKKASTGRIGVIRVRSALKAPSGVVDTLEMLSLHRKNWCAVLEDTPSMKGMVVKVKDYVTYGELDDETFAELVEKRSEEASEDDKTALQAGKKRIKKYFRLNPPRQGYGRAGVKESAKNGGALGYRGPEINKLIRKMI